MRRRISLLSITIVFAAHVAALAAERPVAVSPGSSTAMPMVGGSCPTFNWGSVPGAERWDLVVYRVEASGDSNSLAKVGDGNSPVLQLSLPGSVSGWTPSLDQCLSAGGRYAWTIRAAGRKGETEWSVPSLFEVSEVPSADEVDEALALLERYRRHHETVGTAEATLATVPASAQTHPAAPPVLKKARTTPEADKTGTPERLGGVARRLDGQKEEVGISALTPVPSATPSLTVDDQIHLGVASDIFKDGSVFLWNDTVGNTGLGPESLASNDTGFNNTGIGDRALRDTTTGAKNTAAGHKPLMFNTTGRDNAAFGYQTLLSNTEGDRNTATGSIALRNNTEGSQNTAIGFAAMYFNTLGGLNTATGDYALLSNTEGVLNTAIGYRALGANTTGDRNVAIGFYAGRNATVGDYNIFIANTGVADDAATIKIGTAGTHTETYVAGIRGVNPGVADTLPVLIDSAGQLGTGLSGSADLTFNPSFTCDVLTIAVTGAVAGSPVLLGLPPGDHLHVLTTAWVSAADTVSVRACRGNGGGLNLHANGIYKVAVIPV